VLAVLAKWQGTESRPDAYLPTGQEVSLNTQNIRERPITLLPAVAALAAVLIVAKPSTSQESKDSTGPANGRHSIGLIASDDAGAKEVGLPIYPGARPHRDKSDDTPAAQLGLWGGNSGFKLVVLKMESKDAPDKVAAFYRKALGKYGKVLSCPDSSGSSGTTKSSDGEKSKDFELRRQPQARRG